MNSPAMCTGVRPCCVSVVRGDAPWLRRMWTQSVWPRRAARARGVLPASSPWSTSVSPCSSTSRAWAWPWYACTRHRRRQPLIHRVAKKLCSMYNTSIQPLHLRTKNLKLLLYLKLLAVIYTLLKEVLNSSTFRQPSLILSLVSESLRSAVNRKYILEILSHDWTRVEAGYQKMSFLSTAERRTHITDKTLDISDACVNVELINTFKILGEKMYIPLRAPLTFFYVKSSKPAGPFKTFFPNLASNI